MNRRLILQALQNGEVSLEEARRGIIANGSAPVDSLHAELAESLAAALYMEESQIELDLPFTEMGLDSIVGVEWVNKINKRYGLKIPATKVYDYPTLVDFAGYVGIELKKQGLASLPAISPPVGIPLKNPGVQITQPRPLAGPTPAPAKVHGGIAIVGMSGRYPGAANLTEYWDNLVHARNSIQEIPRERWDWRDHYDPDPAKPGKIYCKWLGTLPEIDCFDPGFFMISAAEAEGMDPQHRLFLEEAYRAFEDAGYSPRTLSDKKCGVYMGIMSSEYVHLLSRQQTTGLNTGNSFSIAAARVPYYLNLKGPAIPIDTACSSSLVAAHLACQALRNGETDMALVGGVTLYLTPASFIGMCAAGMLSADGQCKSFDDGADGFVPGEGVGTLVLKRLEDAERDGDLIHGVIIGSGINHDGRTNGITAPSVTSQIELERDVYQRFNIDPGTIDYVETHGTGTKLGDPIELEALTTVFRELTPRRNFCGIGSVKSNIGHTSAAAGVAGIQKMLLSMKHGKLVPTLNFQRPNSHCDFEDSPFYVNTETKPWSSHAATPRRAAISSFGFSGTNAHVVIEEYVDHRHAVPSLLRDRPALIVLSAKNEERLMEVARNLQSYLKRDLGDSTINIHDLAHTLQVGREAMEERVALAASSIEELIQKLAELLKGGSEVADVWRGRVKRTRGKLALFEADDETAKWIDIRSDRENHARLMELWVIGLIVDWNLFYGANKPRRVSLPTYPFARERYWVSEGPVVEKIITKVSSFTTPPPLVVLNDPARAWNLSSSAAPTSRPLKPMKLHLPVSGFALEAASAKVEMLDHGDGIHAIRVSHQGGESWLSEEVVSSLARSFQKIRDREDAKVILLDGDVFFSGEAKSEESFLEQKISRLIQDCEIPVIAMRNGQMGRLSDFMVDSADAMQLAREIAQSPREALIHLKHHFSRDLAVPETATAEEADMSWLELTANVAPDPGAPESVETGSDVVKLDVYQNGVVLLTLCDTQSKNTFSEALSRGVADSFERIRRTPGYKVVVLTGFGNYFACGGTKDALLAIQEGAAKFTDSKISGLPLECEIPVIAAMQGHGIGAGWSMGLFCDHVFFSEESTYHSPYMRYGFTPGAGATLIFPHQLGQDLGREILFTAREYKGHELKARGMKLPVLPRTEVVSRALQLAYSLAVSSRDALVQMKTARSRHLRANLELTYAREVALHEKTFVGSQEVRARIERQFSQGAATPIELTAPDSHADEADSSAWDAAMLRGIIHTLRDTLATELHTKPANIDVEIPFIEMGLDSINNVTWVRGLNQRYGLSIGATEVYNHPTIIAFADHILKQGKLCGLFLPEKKTTAVPAMAPNPPVVSGLKQEEKEKEPQGIKLRDIAVIGMSGQFPQARNVAEFWDHLIHSKDCISPIPAARWSIDEYYDANPQAPGKTYCKWMGVVEDMDKFDPLFFNISPLEAESMDPQQRLFLESCWSCIEDAGYDPTKLSGSKCGVFAGCGPGEYGLSGDSSEMDASALMGGSMAILAARISYLLNLQGPCVALDTACSSSLVAIASACDSLILGASDLALAGGVSAISGPTMHIMTSKAGMLSPDGRCFTFDQRANGFVPGEGVGVLLLKRLEDAERDGDRIDGVIRGWGVNQDGKTNGITAPNGDSQSRLERDVYERCGLNPEGIQLMEAHGTGTKLGDPIEIEGLKASFRSFTRKENFCALGSVKSNIGHLLAASGVAGVIKALLALKHRQLPPTIHFETLNEHIRLEGSPFYVNTECKEWKTPDGQARRAAVSGFGFSGTNAHVVIEEYQEQAAGGDETTGPVIIVLSAKNSERLKEAARNLAGYLARGGDPSPSRLKEIAYTLQVGRSAMNERLGVIVVSMADLKAKLEAFVTGQEVPGLYLGRAKRSNEGSSSLTADQAIREAMEKWMLTGEYAKLLELWVSGFEIDWNRLYGKTKPRRIGLPTYPFARERYWRKRKSRPAVLGSDFSENNSGLHGPADSIQPPEGKNLLEKTQWKLKQLLGETLNLSVDRIETEEPLESYGIDSILVTRLSEKLREIYPEISQTLFFEFDTLGEIAAYFMEKFPEDTARWTGLDQQKPVTISPAPVVQTVMLQPVEVGCSGAQEPIAIIGISGHYAQADTLDAFWKNLMSGKDCVTEIPAKRWAMEGFFHGDPEAAVRQGKSYSKWGSFLEGFAEFDPLFFNISPLEALGMDPQERLFLQSAWEVLEAAGYTRECLAETINSDVGVFAGVTKTGFDQYRAEWRKQGEIVTPFTSFGGIANRVSYVLNLKGPSMPIDTMCSSSLTAIHEACEQLRHGRCRMAIAGGVNLYVHPSSYVGLCAARMLSRDGKCKSFGAGGDGFVPGEGVGVVLLKPLSKAVADGDFIHAIIRGTSVNHGGKTNGYTVPNPNAQREVIHDALVRSGVDARMVSYVEAHGTGTELGDPIEVTGLTQAFARDTPDTAFCALGSAKSNLGHLEAAAGIAGLTKVVMQMKHRKLAPSLHAAVLNPQIHFPKTPFVVQQELADWQRPILLRDGRTTECPRIAGISSFGAGGANAHVIIEEAPQMSDPGVSRTGPVLVVLSAKTEERLQAYARKLGDFLNEPASASDLDLHDLAFTLQIGREAMEERVAYIIQSVSELREKLNAFVEKPGSVEEGCFRGRVQRNRENLSSFYGDEDMLQTIEAWLRKGRLARLAELWVRGGSLDWGKLYGENLPRRIALPTYPFAKEEYWVEVKPAQAAGKSCLHPMVHANESDLTGLRFSSTFSGGEFFVADHVVNGAKVLPGVAYLEMALFAARQVTGTSSDRVIIRNIVWTRPIFVENTGTTVHIRLVDAEKDGLSFSIEAETLACSQGFVLVGRETETPILDLPRLRDEIAGRRMDGPECYAAFTAMGMNYGPCYQGIQDVSVGAGQALARLALPVSLTATENDYVMHPSLLDAALQACIGLSLLEGADPSGKAITFVPYALDEAEVFAPCVSKMWAWIRPQSEAMVPKLDIDLCDENGRVSVALRGLSFRRFEGSTGRDENDATLLMSPEWTAAEVSTDAPPVEYAGRLVLLGGMDALSPETMELSWPGITCLRLCGEGETLEQRFAEASVHAFGIIREILGARAAKGKQLVQIVIPSDAEGLLLGGLSGLLKTARLENPDIVGQVIAVNSHETEEGLLRKLKESSRCPEDIQIRDEGGLREVISWREVPGAPTAATVPWKDGGVYLITGGAGGLGMIFAEAVAKQTKGAQLILCGRSELSQEKQTSLSAIEHSGAKITYRRTDISQLWEVEQLIAEIQKDYGTLDGVFHGAGIVHDHLIVNKSEGEFRDVLAPKVSGTVHLDQATKEMSLDFFVLFSAGAGVFGNPGQADYATANAFMDEFASYRNTLVSARRRRGVTLSVDWPLWEAGGMTMDESAVAAMKEKLGMTPMATGAGIDALLRALASGKDQILVVSGERLRLQSPIFKETEKKTTRSPDGSLEEKTMEYFRELLSSTLRVPLHRIHPDAVMSDLGIDSVVVMGLTNRLEESLGSLSKTLFFEHQTVRALARYFIESRSEKLERLFQPEVTIPHGDGKFLNGTPSRPRVLSLAPSPKTFVQAEPRSAGALDIAIIGVSGRYPKAKNIDEFWEVLRDGRDCITEVPADRWDWRDYYSEDPAQTRGHSSKWGGFIDGVDQFDPQFFNISPRIAPYLDPQERLILEEAWKALEDAGYRREDLQKQAGEEVWSPVGVYIGAMYGEYQLLGAEASLAGQRLGFAGNLASIANRLSYVLNLHGPSMMVDTMCSSSLTCIHLACQDLAAGRTNYALAGGVNVTIHPNKYLMLSGGQFLSAAGRCESFGEGGAGYIPSEGVGVVVLKRLADAERDGDHIYGVIKSSAVNHGGRTHGYSVPNPKAQERVIAQALEEARIDPRAVSYIEAHGTGTKLGDPIEIAGLARAFGRQPGDVRCWLGSAKSNIGHCESAAGIAGLTKVLLQMKHGQIAPSLHSQVLNPHIDFASTPFVVNQTLREWKQPLIDGKPAPRIAGVSSFGAGGSNAHLLVEEYRGKSRPVVLHDTRHAALVVLSAKSADRLIEIARNLLDHLQQSNDSSPELLRNLAYSLQVGREAMEERLGLVVFSMDELKDKLGQFIDGSSDVSGLVRGRVDDAQGNDAHERMEEGNDSKLLERWVRGIETDWQRLYGGDKPRRISLPTYPFVRKRFWVESVREMTAPELHVRPLTLKTESMGAWRTVPLGKPSGVLLAPLPAGSSTPTMVDPAPELPAPTAPPALAESGIRDRERKEESVNRTPSSVAPQALQDELRSSLAQVLFLEDHELGLDKPFLEMGLDSIVGVEWVNAINKKYRLTIPASQVYEHPSLRKFTDFLHQQLQPSETLLQDAEPPRTADPIRVESQPPAAILGAAPSEPVAHRVSETKATDIAIIGMAGQFPGGQTLDEFWHLLKTGQTAFTDFPQDRDWGLIESLQENSEPHKAALGQGAFLKEVDCFDPLFFQISPKEAMTMDPGERLFLQESWKAIEDAGIVPADISGRRWGVFCGNGGDYSLRIKEVVGYSPHVTLAQVPSRVSHCLNLTGPSQSVDAGCASALLAIAQACDHLVMGKCEVAIAGGVLVHSTPNLIVSASQVELLARNGTGGRALDRSASGMVPGEAAGVLVLKPLTDALAAGDRIYGVIEGWGNNHNGKTNGMVSPSIDSQEALFSEVYDRYEIAPDEINFVEANAAGLPLADAAEVHALTSAFRKKSTRHGFCALGSVENNVGHAFHASGMSHMMKVLLSLWHRQIPATLHFQSSDPTLELERSPFFINTETIPWKVGDGERRRAAISSFGATGANVHLVIAETPAVEAEKSSIDLSTSGLVLIPLSSKTALGLKQRCRDLAAHLQNLSSGKNVTLRQLSANLLLRRSHFEHRCALVVDNIATLKSRLLEIAEGKEIVDGFIGSIDLSQRLGPSFYLLAESKIDDLNKGLGRGEEDLLILADLFVQGVKLEMTTCFSSVEKRPLSLPPYAFEKRRCWISAPRKSELRSDNGDKESSTVAAERATESTTTLEILKGFLAEITGLSTDEIDPGSKLSEYGIDSLLGMRLLNRVNARFGGEFNASLLMLETIGRVVEEIASKGSVRLDASGKVSPLDGPWVRPAFIESLTMKIIAMDSGVKGSVTGNEQLERLIAHGVGVWKEPGTLCFEFLEKTQTPDSLAHLVDHPQALYTVLEDGKRYFPASGMQKFSLHESEINKRTSFNLCQGFWIDLPVDMQALNAVFNDLVRRHSIFRTGAHLFGQQWTQVVHDHLAVKCREIEWPLITSKELFEAELAKFQKERNGELFDIGHAPLLDVYFIHNGKTLGAVFFCTHHFHADGFTLYLFQQELHQRYMASVLNQPYEMSKALAEYAHLALSQFGPERTMVAEYWLNKLRGKRGDFVLKDQAQYLKGADEKAGVIELKISPTMLASLQEFNRRNQTTLTQLVTCALASLLYRLTGVSLPIQMVYNLRDRHEFESLLGDFSSSLPILLEIGENFTVQDVLQAYETEMLDLQRHKHFDFSLLLGEGDVALDSNDRDAFGEVTDFAERLIDMTMEDRQPVASLLVCVVKTHGKMTLPVMYARSRFSHRSIELFVENLVSVLDQMLCGVGTPISELEISPVLVKRLASGSFSPLNESADISAMDERRQIPNL